MAAVEDRPFDVAGEVKRLHDFAERVCLGPSTRAIVLAAKARGIPVRPLNVGSLILLGQGVHARRIWTAESDQTSAIAESIASDKELTKKLLRASGIPVPEGRQVDSAEDAWDATDSLGSAVVVKPLDANHGRAVFTGLTDKSEVLLAYEQANREGNGVIVERFVSGSEHRLLVVGDRMVAAARGDYAYVVGDGKCTIAELVESQLNSDPRRGDDENCPLNLIVLDAANCVTLEQQEYKPDSIPLKHAKVLIQRSDNLATDVTDLVHSEVAETAVHAAKVVGLDIAGIDIVARDISLPLKEQGGIVVEVNSGPGLLMHLAPARGTPRPVGEAIVEKLFPLDGTSRIPITAIAGSTGTAEVTRLVDHLWASKQLNKGVAASFGTYVGTRCLQSANSANQKAQQSILINPRVEAAIFELTTTCALGEGLGFDRCQVAVVTNVDPTEDLADWYFDDIDRLVQAKRIAVDVVLPAGFAVLNADDPLVAPMAENCQGKTVFFAADAENSVLSAHTKDGGTAITVEDGKVHLITGDRREVVAILAKLPWVDCENVSQLDVMLAAIGAAWAMQVPLPLIRAGLESYSYVPEKFSQAEPVEMENR